MTFTVVMPPACARRMLEHATFNTVENSNVGCIGANCRRPAARADVAVRIDMPGIIVLPLRRRWSSPTAA
jgi:hypothetical protein